MCGIFTLLNNKNNSLEKEFIIKQFNESQHRGPDNSQIYTQHDIFVGFHRLAINGIDQLSDQPLIIDNILLICNGEIYNYKQLYENIKTNAKTNSDCEIIIYLYQIYGIEYTLNLLDGVFAFVLIDYNINRMFIARDPYGVRPLFYFKNNINEGSSDTTELIGFASEMKQLCGFIKNRDENRKHESSELEITLKPKVKKYSKNNKMYPKGRSTMGMPGTRAQKGKKKWKQIK